MMVLALEFSSPERSVAVVQLNGGARRVLGDVTDAGARDLKPLELVQKALDLAGISQTSVECIAVGLGPGSYTGIRSAIAVAQGWQLARDVKLIGISTVECLAAQAQSRGWFGTVYTVIDAQRDELYVAAYSIADAWTEIAPLHLRPVNEMIQLLQSTKQSTKSGQKNLVIGPEVDRWFADGYVVRPSAAQLGQLVPGRTNFATGEKLEPIYLRETHFVKAPPPRVIS